MKYIVKQGDMYMNDCYGYAPEQSGAWIFVEKNEANVHASNNEGRVVRLRERPHKPTLKRVAESARKAAESVDGAARVALMVFAEAVYRG